MFEPGSGSRDAVRPAAVAATGHGVDVAGRHGLAVEGARADRHHADSVVPVGDDQVARGVQVTAAGAICALTADPLSPENPSIPLPATVELVRSMAQRWVAWMGAGMPVQAIWAAAAMSFWWLVRHTG